MCIASLRSRGYRLSCGYHRSCHRPPIWGVLLILRHLLLPRLPRAMVGAKLSGARPGLEGRYEATWKRICKLPWRKTGLLKSSE